MKKRILILGASYFQIPLVEQAKEMGLYVGIVDINKDAHAAKYADEAFQCSIKDKKAVLKIAREFKADAVCVGICDSAMNTAAYICEQLGLPGTSVETAKRATDKFEMIKAFEKHGVAHPKYQLIKKGEFSSTKIVFDYPFIIKPTDSAGSKGVRVVHNEEELNSIYQESLKYADSGEIIVEELMTGIELSCELIVQNGIPFVAQVTDKITTGEPYFIEIGQNQPSHFKGETLEAIKDLACRAAIAVGLVNSIAHAEIMVTDEGPKMVEIGGRMAGDGVSEQMMMVSAGYNIPEASINFSLGKEFKIVDKNINTPVAVRFILTKHGTVTRVAGLDEARKSEGVFGADIIVKEGEYYEDATDNKGRIGYVHASGRTREEASRNCEEAINKIIMEVE